MGKNKKYTKKLLTFIVLLIVSLNCTSQVKYSIHTGIGTHTNLGGITGLGFEVKYKEIAFNTSLGTRLGRFPERPKFTTGLDYDFGVKFYSNNHFFLGINYGLISEQYYESEFSKYHGFSFTGGYRKEIFTKFYLSLYLGFTSNQDANFPFLNSQFIFPRMGLLIGYELNYSKSQSE